MIKIALFILMFCGNAYSMEIKKNMTYQVLIFSSRTTASEISSLKNKNRKNDGQPTRITRLTEHTTKYHILNITPSTDVDVESIQDLLDTGKAQPMQKIYWTHNGRIRRELYELPDDFFPNRFYIEKSTP